MGSGTSTGADHTADSVSKDGSIKTVQYIALEICTMPHGFDTPAPQDDWYVGLQDPDADLKQRVLIVKKVLDYVSCEPSIDPNALKVFMMPEFFFRGRIGAYTLQEMMGEDRNTGGSVQDLLCSWVLDAKWKKCIFVFGSVVGYKRIRSEGDVNFEVYNCSIVVQGGLLNLEESRRASVVCLKEHLSGIDFLQTAGLGGLSRAGCGMY